VSVARFIADQRTFYRVPHAFTCRVLAVSEAWFYKLGAPVAAAGGAVASVGVLEEAAVAVRWMRRSARRSGSRGP